MATSSKSNGKILTPCHIDVNKKKCNSLDDVTGNGVTIRKTRKKDFTERELKTIGLKIGELVRLSGRDAVDVAAEGVPVVAHVATDNYAGGVEAGKLMGTLLDGKGTVAIISYPG